MNAKETNTLLINSINQKKSEQSIRLMQFINMYNLKRDEIVYLCPLLKNDLNDEEFELEVECLEELADLEIIYNADRKKQLDRIRAQEQKIRDKQAEAERNNKSSQGFFGRLFGGKNSSKERPQSLTPSKLKIDNSLIRSSSYLKPSSSFRANQLYSSQVKNSAVSIKSFESDIPQSNVQKEQKSKTNSNSKKQNPFKDDMIDADENHLLPDLAASIGPIAQADQDADSQVSRISSVTRLIAHENDSNNVRVDTSRRSKRNTILDDSDEHQEESVKVEPLPLSMKKKSNSKHAESSKKQKIKPSTDSKVKTPQDNSSDILNPYIPKDTPQSLNDNQNNSGSSIHSHSPQFSRLSVSKIVPSKSNDPSFVEESSIIEDPAVLLIKKIEACELREKILTNRLKERWNKQQQQLGRIRKITLQSITPEIKHDPQLRWAKPNFNFGKIID